MTPIRMSRAVVLLAGLLTLNAQAYIADPPKSDAAAAKSEAVVSAKVEDELKVPIGWQKKTRGKYVLYCKKETPMGSRIPGLTCYDELNMRNYMLALQESKQSVDRIRNTCGNVCVCGNPESCNPNIRQ